MSTLCFRTGQGCTCCPGAVAGFAYAALEQWLGCHNLPWSTRCPGAYAALKHLLPWSTCCPGAVAGDAHDALEQWLGLHMLTWSIYCPGAHTTVGHMLPWSSGWGCICCHGAYAALEQILPWRSSNRNQSKNSCSWVRSSLIMNGSIGCTQATLEQLRPLPPEQTVDWGMLRQCDVVEANTGSTAMWQKAIVVNTSCRSGNLLYTLHLEHSTSFSLPRPTLAHLPETLNLDTLHHCVLWQKANCQHRMSPLRWNAVNHKPAVETLNPKSPQPTAYTLHPPIR